MGRATSERPTTGQREQERERPAVWSAYGKLVRLFRERSGLTQQALAEAIGYSLEQVASVEQGRRPAKGTFTDAAERVLGAGGALRVLQEDVDRAKLPEFFRDFALLEAEAVSRFSYDPLLIPGLLQTEAYARTLLEAHFPPLDDETVDERVSARLARQALLTRKRPSVVCVFLIEESALRRPVGGASALREQLEQILTTVRMRNVDVQVMPSERATHSGLNGPMVLLEVAAKQQYVYVEAQDIVSVRSAPAEVSEFWLRYGMLRAQALGPEQSVHLIERVAGAL